ncbi:uncharacterized protein LOC102458339 isoform X2 [Pelodiscus sinensis]|uniref:uncharacterized protein LOC102458339 isoform X2 n=1 Tax=Pelodiscus sinensis TaxID=13735 RepID=UPI003F6B47C5
MSKFIYLPFIVLLSSVLLTEQASEPNCAGIADFDNCLDNTEGFCPNDVACGCKDSKPYCKKQARQRELESQQNPVFVPEVADNSRYVSHPQLSQDNWTTDNIKMPKAQLKNQSFVQPGEVGSSSYIPHQPSGRPVPTADSYFGFQSHQHNQNSHFPDVDYEENGPTPVLPGRQFPKSGIPEFSRFDRFQSVAQPMANPNSGRPGRPYEIGRLQKYI